MEDQGEKSTEGWKERVTDFETGKVLQWWKQPSSRFNAFLMVAATRLGDGWLWALVAPWVLWDMGYSQGWQLVWRGTTVGLTSVLIYKVLKKRFNRPRPFERHDSVEALHTPPDQFSFPSGHTMNNMAISLYAGHFVPDILPYLLPIVVLVGFSRVYLRVHYPTDVLIGGFLGGLVALAYQSIPLFSHL